MHGKYTKEERNKRVNYTDSPKFDETRLVLPDFP